MPVLQIGMGQFPMNGARPKSLAVDVQCSWMWIGFKDPAGQQAHPRACVQRAHDRAEVAQGTPMKGKQLLASVLRT